MEIGFKARSFAFVYWVMLLVLVGDTVDTFYRFVSGYLGGGSSFPGVDVLVQPTTLDLIVFIIVQTGVVYGIYLLYSLKKTGGYWFVGSQLLFLIYASFFGPIAKIGILNILTPILLFFLLYVFLTIFIPWFYSEKFK